MAVYPRGARFMASVGTGAARVRRTFKTEGEALAWEKAQTPATAPPGALPGHSPKVWTLQQAFEHVSLHQWRGKGGAEKAELNAQQALAFFGPNTACSAINATEVVRFMTHLIGIGNSPATRNKKMSALRVMLTAATDFGGLPALPKMKRVRERRPDPAWFREEDEAAMLAQATLMGSPALHDFIVIGLDQGFRRSELLALTPAMYHGDALVLPGEMTKNGKPRRVPVSDRVRRIVEARIAAGYSPLLWPLTESVLRGLWEDLRDRLGRSDDPMFTPHKLRHTCATRMVAKGENVRIVQAWLGHEVIETTMRYSHLAPGALDAARDRMQRKEAA
jgi:integrase